MFDRLDQATDDEARRQRGLVTMEQARAIGLSPAAIRHRVRTGRWIRRHENVFLAAAVPRDWRQDLLAACLATGDGVVSHRSAAALLGFWPEGVVEVTVARHRQPRIDAGVIVHRSRDLIGDMVTARDGISVTTAARTLVDLGAVVGERAVDSAIDAAVGRRLATFGEVLGLLDQLACRGRRGAGVLRACLERRHLFTADSPLELRMERLLRDHDLPPAVPQYVVWAGDRVLGRVDFAYADLRVAIEVDGYGPHSSVGAFQYDRARQNELVAAGWIVLRFTWDDVIRRPHYVAGVIRRVLGARCAA